MKKIENSFAVTGFVAKDAEIRQFTNASVARFPLSVARQEKNGEDTKRVSAFVNMEAWRKNENAGSFDVLTKGTLLTVEGYFKPEEWADKDGVLRKYPLIPTLWMIFEDSTFAFRSGDKHRSRRIYGK